MHHAPMHPLPVRVPLPRCHDCSCPVARRLRVFAWAASTIHGVGDRVARPCRERERVQGIRPPSMQMNVYTEPCDVHVCKHSQYSGLEGSGEG